MLLLQLVAIRTLPDLAAAKTPLAYASLLFILTAFSLLISSRSVISILFTNMLFFLTFSLILFTL